MNCMSMKMSNILYFHQREFYLMEVIIKAVGSTKIWQILFFVPMYAPTVRLLRYVYLGIIHLTLLQ